MLMHLESREEWIHIGGNQRTFPKQNYFLEIEIVFFFYSCKWFVAQCHLTESQPWFTTAFFFFFPLLAAPVPLSKSVNLFQNCMSSVGARAYGSILNQCTPTVCILRGFNFFSLFLLILMGMHLAPSVTKDTPSQIWIPYIHGRGEKKKKTVVKSEWGGLMELKVAPQYRADLECLFVVYGCQSAL